jgi:type IV secretion system protein VirB8
MAHDTQDDLGGYYAQSRGWALDRIEAMQASRRRAMLVACAASALALVEGVALLAIAPLKTVVPYTILVDRQTGYVQALDPSGRSPLAPDAALVNSLLVQYVEAREGFDIAQVQASYAKVGLWSAEAARSDYLRAMDPANRDGPVAGLPRATTIEVQVKSVSPIADHVALVRFDTVRRDGTGATGTRAAWAVVLRYRFSAAPMSTADRFHNPLGFQVVRYRREPEVLPPPPLPSPSPPPPHAPPSSVEAPAAARIDRPLSPQMSSTGQDDRSIPLGNPLIPYRVSQR